MAQAIPRERVLSVLQRRYDHHSAQVVLKRAVEVVKLQDQEHYTSEELQSISQGLQKVGDRLDALIGPLMALAGAAVGTPPTWEAPKGEAARAEPKPEPARAPEPAPVVRATAPTMTESASPAVTAAPGTTTAETRATRITADATATAETTAAAGPSAAAVEDAASPQHENSGEAEGESTEAAAEEEPRETKGRQRRKR